jgi:hypothetical protein
MEVEKIILSADLQRMKQKPVSGGEFNKLNLLLFGYTRTNMEPASAHRETYVTCKGHIDGTYDVVVKKNWINDMTPQRGHWHHTIDVRLETSNVRVELLYNTCIGGRIPLEKIQISPLPKTEVNPEGKYKWKRNGHMSSYTQEALRAHNHSEKVLQSILGSVERATTLMDTRRTKAIDITDQLLKTSL